MQMAVAGGVLIGLSALMLYAALGRIAGISGIAYGALDAEARGWRLPFLIGLGGGAWLAVALGVPLPAAPLPQGAGPVVVLAAAGLLVGFGTRLGNGCTSGHGVCGIARLSKRSLIAVMVFMATGMLTASLSHGLLPGVLQ